MFNGPLGGKCIDREGDDYNFVKSTTTNIITSPYDKVEACGRWCLSFRAPGFVGFGVSVPSSYGLCYCGYSGDPPQGPDDGTVDGRTNVNSGSGAVESGDGNVNIDSSLGLTYNCYPIKVRTQISSFCFHHTFFRVFSCLICPAFHLFLTH